jgi:hypothetical protein
MERERLNLSALDPAANTERWELLIGTIKQRALPELARRATARSPLVFLAGWARPMLAAAAALAAISLGVLGTAVEAELPGGSQAVGLIEELQVPAPLATWLTEERGPTVDDLILALDGDFR